MPRGLSCCRWDDKVGLRVVGVYPRNLDVSEEDMLRVFTAHALGKPEPGFLTMTLEGTNLAVASYYTGIVHGRDQFCIMLFLDPDEDARSYEEGLTLAASEIIENIGEPEFTEYLGEMFEKLKRMVELTVEQRLAKVFVDQETRLLMHKLSRGGIPAEELREWLELQTGKHYPDLGLLTLPLLRSGLAEEDWINAVSDNCVFMVNDLFGARFPPEQPLKLAKSGGLTKEQAREYEKRIREFFSSYTWSEQDTIMLGQLLLDPDTYDVIKLLRRKIIHKSELAEVLEGRGSVDSVLRRLESANIITLMGSNTIEVQEGDDPLVLLLSDIHFESFFPEFLVLRIQERLAAKDIHPDIAKRHLELLSETYMRMREKMKEAKKKRKEKKKEEAPALTKEEKKRRKEEEKKRKEEEKRRKKEEEKRRKEEKKRRKEEEKKRRKEEKRKKEERREEEISEVTIGETELEATTTVTAELTEATGPPSEEQTEQPENPSEETEETE